MSLAPLKVGIDGFNLAMPDGTGVASYGRSLGTAIKGLGGELHGLFAAEVTRATPPILREILFYESLDPPPAPQRRWPPQSLRDALQFGRYAVETPLTGHVDSGSFRDRLPPFDRILAAPDLFERAMRSFRRSKRFLTIRVPDPPPIMHWTYPLPLRMAGARNIYTVHDLVPLKLPHTTLDRKRLHFRLVNQCLQSADRIVTVSETSRRDILSLFPRTRPDLVVNTYQALPDFTLQPRSEAELRWELKSLHNLHYRGYFLFFGAIEPKKNVGRMLQAYLAAGLDTPLVLVGARAWKSESELKPIAHGPARVRRMDYLPRSQLTRLIRGARAVVFPSLYEGFGLPALEAMALGAPMLTSTAGSLPEVVGDAAMLVDPYDVSAMTEAFRTLDADRALRERLSAAGLARAEVFSMAAYQARLSVLYRDILAAAPRRTRPRTPDARLDEPS